MAGMGKLLCRGKPSLQRRPIGNGAAAPARVHGPLFRYRDANGDVCAAEAEPAPVQTRNYAGAAADHVAAALHDHVGGAVPFQASNLADSSTGRGHARDLPWELR